MFSLLPHLPLSPHHRLKLPPDPVPHHHTALLLHHPLLVVLGPVLATHHLPHPLLGPGHGHAAALLLLLLAPPAPEHLPAHPLLPALRALETPWTASLSDLVGRIISEELEVPQLLPQLVHLVGRGPALLQQRAQLLYLLVQTTANPTTPTSAPS